jgi:TonB family protein
VRSPRLALAALMSAACGSSRPADSASAADREQPADAGVSLGRPSEPRDGGVPDLPPTVVRNDVLERRRLSGNTHTEPDADDRALLADGKKAFGVTVKFCVDSSGKVSSTKILKSSGSPRFDEKLLREIRSWTYSPIVSEGEPVDVCTVRTFLYRPPATPPPAAP